jgi:RNA polymerase sigma-70 factor (ECF subfamily)
VIPPQRRGPGPEAPDALTSLALAARGGDPGASAAFVRATQADVWRFVAALLDTQVADDLTQETYLRAFRALPRYEGRSSVRTWLLGIARRTCADHLRTLARSRRLDTRLAAERAAHATDPAVTLAAADLLRRLPPDRRAAFALTQVLGLSYAEAAEVEAVPVGTIRSRVARARAELVDAVTRAMAS